MDFTRKARFVAGGHVTDPPECLTYSSVVSRETVRIVFLLAALNDLDICAADISNAYLNADCAERIYTVAGKEFGPKLQGKVLIVPRVLYGLKSSGVAWRQHLSSSIKDMGFTSSRMVIRICIFVLHVKMMAPNTTNICWSMWMTSYAFHTRQRRLWMNSQNCIV